MAEKEARGEEIKFRKRFLKNGDAIPAVKQRIERRHLLAADIQQLFCLLSLVFINLIQIFDFRLQHKKPYQQQSHAEQRCDYAEDEGAIGKSSERGNGCHHRYDDGQHLQGVPKACLSLALIRFFLLDIVFGHGSCVFFLVDPAAGHQFFKKLLGIGCVRIFKRFLVVFQGVED